MDISFKYLGIPNGGNSRKKGMWDNMVRVKLERDCSNGMEGNYHLYSIFILFVFLHCSKIIDNGNPKNTKEVFVGTGFKREENCIGK